jgi:hypothetical protein
MTQEEISRFALQLSEAERIRALMAQDADSKDGIPLATELPVEEPQPVSTGFFGHCGYGASAQLLGRTL